MSKTTKIVANEKSEITYYIKEKEGIVIAKVNKKDIVRNVVDSLTEPFTEQGTNFREVYLSDIFEGLIFGSSYYKLLPDYFVGKAVCSVEDEFDVEIGKKIASERALTSYYKVRLKFINIIADFLSEKLDKCEDQLNYSWLKYNKYYENNMNITKIKEENSK